MKHANRTRDAPLKKIFEFFSKKDEVLSYAMHFVYEGIQKCLCSLTIEYSNSSSSSNYSF